MATEFKDYYETLGVGRDADAAAIKKAFRKLARKFHPDVAEDKGAAEEKFKEINEAYEVLGDPEKRKRYDELGSDWNRQGPPPPPGGSAPGWTAADEGYEFEGTGFSDFFERYFGGGGFRGSFGRGAAARGPGGPDAPLRGHDIEGDLMVTLREAMEGAMRTIAMRLVDPQTGGESVQEVHVRIPAGIREGQRLRVPGHGGRGLAGGEAGDLYLRVRLAADPDFRVRGHDLYRDLPLAPWEAVLGTTVQVVLPGGRSVQVRVPPGTGSGDQLRLRGYGLPNKSGAGDLYVVVGLEVPDAPGAAERALWEKLRDTSNFDPRSS